MDESSTVQNRRQRRSNVLLTARVETNGRLLEVKLRNLSAQGALVEGQGLPPEGTEINFHKGELTVAGIVVWLSNQRAGLQFHQPLSPEALLRHVPVPRPRVLPAFRRPPITPQPMTKAERLMEKLWGVPVAPKSPRD
jgi:hypothetical protein